MDEVTTKNTRPNLWLVAGAVSGFLAVAAGAFGAHKLKSVLSSEMLRTYETAVQYQMAHALGLLAVAWVRSLNFSTASRVAGWGFLIGSFLFSGSLYALVGTGIKELGIITMFGGISFLVGWAALAYVGLTAKTR